MSSVNQILSELYRDRSSYQLQPGRWKKCKARSQLLVVKTNPNIPQSCKRELKPFLSIAAPPPAPLGLCHMRLWKPFRLFFLMVNPAVVWMSSIMPTGSRSQKQPLEGQLNTACIGFQPTHSNLLVITTTLPSSSGRAVRTGVIAAGLSVKSHAERFRARSPSTQWLQSFLLTPSTQ